MKHVCLLLSLLCVTCVAQETKPIPETVQLKFAASYHKVMQYQSEYQSTITQVCQNVPECKAALDRFNKSANEHQANLPAWRKESGLPTDASFVIDDKDKVTGIISKPTPPPAPASPPVAKPPDAKK